MDRIILSDDCRSQLQEDRRKDQIKELKEGTRGTTTQVDEEESKEDSDREFIK